MKDKISALSQLKSAIMKKTPKDLADYMDLFKNTDQDDQEEEDAGEPVDGVKPKKKKK